MVLHCSASPCSLYKKIRFVLQYEGAQNDWLMILLKQCSPCTLNSRFKYYVQQTIHQVGIFLHILPLFCKLHFVTWCTAKHSTGLAQHCKHQQAVISSKHYSCVGHRWDAAHTVCAFKCPSWYFSAWYKRDVVSSLRLGLSVML